MNGIDGTDVPVIYGAPTKEGWRHDTVMVHGRREEVLVAPDGTRYVRAAGGPADLIVDLTARRLGCLRLRLLEGSPLAKKAKREAQLVRRGAAAKERTRTRRKP